MFFVRNHFAIVCWLSFALGSFNGVHCARYCGKELVGVLTLLCEEYVSMHDIKKSELMPYWEMLANRFANAKSQGGQYLGEDDHTGNAEFGKHQVGIGKWFPNWDKAAAMDVPQAHQWTTSGNAVAPRFRREVAKECCDQDCSLNDLLAYCKVVAPGVLSSAVA